MHVFSPNFRLGCPAFNVRWPMWLSVNVLKSPSRIELFILGLALPLGPSFQGGAASPRLVGGSSGWGDGGGCLPASCTALPGLWPYTGARALGPSTTELPVKVIGRSAAEHVGTSGASLGFPHVLPKPCQGQRNRRVHAPSQMGIWGLERGRGAPQTTPVDRGLRGGRRGDHPTS